jgi:hypothetical protein
LTQDLDAARRLQRRGRLVGADALLLRPVAGGELEPPGKPGIGGRDEETAQRGRAVEAEPVRAERAFDVKVRTRLPPLPRGAWLVSGA